MVGGARKILTLVLVVLLVAASVPGTRAQTPYTDAELTQGFLLTVFGAEGRSGAGATIVKKFTRPVRYRIVSKTADDWRDTVRAFADSLDGAIEHLSLREAAPGEAVNMTIFLVDRENYRAVIRETVWEGVDVDFLAFNACSAVLAARSTGIEKAHIYLVADEGFLGLSHCLVEELSQSLGPANDSDDLQDSIFNDRSDLSVFGVFDWFILSILYDPRIEAGMTADEVRPLLPAVIADARERLERLFAADAPALAHSGGPGRQPGRNHGATGAP